MLEFVAIQNFKTFRAAEFELGGLNIFAGLNGTGKSTFIQSLLVLRQSFDAAVLQQGRLLLNGKLVELGTGADVLAESAEDDVISFELQWQEGQSAQFQFAYAATSDCLQQRNAPVLSETLAAHALFQNRFQYLSANRIGPRGEYAAHFIAQHQMAPIGLLALRHPDATSDSLPQNLEAWMGVISPGLRIKADVLPALNAAGLSCALPVVTALLSAKAGDLVVVEHPEAYVHPAGQAQLGRLCAIAAQHGVQLIVETHSDHFINGVRVAAKKRDIDAALVRIFFLERRSSGPTHDTVVSSLVLDADGRLNQWPHGFLDEWDRQLRELL